MSRRNPEANPGLQIRLESLDSEQVHDHVPRPGDAFSFKASKARTILVFCVLPKQIGPTLNFPVKMAVQQRQRPVFSRCI